MPQRTPSCQLPRPTQGDSRSKSPSSSGIPCQSRDTQSHVTRDTIERLCESGGQVEPVRGTAQEVANTASRRSGPRRWLRAVEWLIAAGHHPRANATTLRVAGDLAGRMDYDTGHVRYCLEETAARLGIDRSTVKRHVAALRELGALAWLVHGTKANIRRALGLGGYAGTATIYAAVIPPVYDHAMGHRIVGSGYDARAIVDQTGRTPKPVDNPPVDNQDSGACAPPSLTVVKEVGQVQVESGFKDTSRKRASRSTESPTQDTNSSSKGGESRRTASQVRRCMWITRQVRARVNWTQNAKLRRLEYVLRPLTDAGMDVEQITAELHSWMLTWRPLRPAEYIRTRLAQQAQNEQLATTADIAEGWDEDEAARPMSASRPGLVRSVLEGLQRGMAAYSANQAAKGLDDLTDADAAADMAALLSTGASA